MITALEVEKLPTLKSPSFSYLRKAKSDIRKVVIVHPFTYQNPYYTLPPVTPEYVQAAAINAGKEAVVLDMRFEVDVRDELQTADLVCLFGHSETSPLFTLPSHHLIPEVLHYVPDTTPVIAGGTGFLTGEAALRDYPKIDIIVSGSPEAAISSILSNDDLLSVSNILCRTEDGCVSTKRKLLPLSENIYPIRAFRNPAYKYHLGGIDIDLVRTGVGCNYKCKFCYEYGKDMDRNFIRWQGRSAESLVEEIRTIKAPIIACVDDDVTTDMNKLSGLADALIANEIRKLYIGVGRIDHVLKSDVATLQKLERAGFLALSMGLESVKEETLRLYKKGLSLKKIEDGLEMLNKTNILLFCTFLLGSPGETEEDMMKILSFGRKWNVDSLGTNRLRNPADSPLHAVMYNPETGELKPGMEYIEGEELARIKFKIKFGQRTPLRLVLSLLKLYRHQGMPFDPAYLFVSAIHTMIKGTLAERTMVIPGLLALAKRLLSRPMVFRINAFLARIIAPPVRAVNSVFEAIDEKTGLTTFFLPKVFLYLNRQVFQRQRESIQIRGFMQEQNQRRKAYSC